MVMIWPPPAKAMRLGIGSRIEEARRVHGSSPAFPKPIWTTLLHYGIEAVEDPWGWIGGERQPHSDSRKMLYIVFLNVCRLYLQGERRDA